jgi:uncharacterized membrane protein
VEEISNDSFAERLSDRSGGILVSILGVSLLAIFIALGAYAAHFWGQSLEHEYSNWGNFGSYLGGVLGPVFSFLSMLALLVALVLQTRELRLSRESLVLSREELRLSREEQAKSAEALAAQNISIQRQGFEQTFFTWLTTYREVLGEVQGPNKSVGRNALVTLWTRELRADFVSPVHQYAGDLKIGAALLQSGLDNIGLATAVEFPLLAKGAIGSWDSLYRENESQLDSLFRVLYRLIKWVDEYPEKQLSVNEKWHYISIVRSQLSWVEMVFLFYNGMTQRGAKFKHLVERYALFDNLTIESDKLLVILRECPTDLNGYSQAAYNSDKAREMIAAQ